MPDTDPLAEMLPCVGDLDLCTHGRHAGYCPAYHRDAVRAHVAAVEADRDKWKRHATGFMHVASENLARAEAAEAKLRNALADPEVTNG